MPVVVAGAYGDDRDPRPKLFQLISEPGVGGSVVRDLEDLDRWELKATGDIGLRIRGEQRIGLSVRGDEHDGVVVRVVARCPRPVGPNNPEPERADPERLPRARDDDLDAALPRCGTGRTLVRALIRDRRVEHGAHAQLLQDLSGTADVIPLRMREDDERESRRSEAL